MCQVGRIIQDRLTKRIDAMDWGSIGMMMEIYMLGDGRETIGLRGRCTSYKRMVLIHFSTSSMIDKRMK